MIFLLVLFLIILPAIGGFIEGMAGFMIAEEKRKQLKFLVQPSDKSK